MKMPCDAVILEGMAVTNEAMLTGESVPVIKNELPRSDWEIYSPSIHQKYTLFAGTEVI